MRIVIVEDHSIIRRLLRGACTHEYGHEVVGEAADGLEVLEVIARTKPELLLLDLQLPQCDGFGVLTMLRRSSDPQPRIIVFSGYCDDYTVYRIERAHVQGFVDKRAGADDALRKAIDSVSKGGVYFSEAYQKVKASRREDPFSFDKVLSEREQVVLKLVGELLADSEIATRLGISEQTAEKHRFNILRKLGLRTRTDLIRYSRDHGFAHAMVCQPPR